MLERWALNLVIAFIMRQLAKFGQTIDWAKVKADLDERVRALVPGTWFDDEVVALVNMVLDRCAEVLAHGAAIEALLKLLADQKWDEALQALKALLLGGWVPVGTKVVKTANGHTVQGEGVGAKAWQAVASL